MSIDVTPSTTRNLTERVGMEIRVLMLLRGISGRKLAAKMGVSQTWLSSRLVGTTPIDLNDLQRIADALEVAPADLLLSKLSEGHVRVTADYRPAAPRTPVAKITGHAARHTTGRREPRRPVLLSSPNAG